MFGIRLRHALAIGGMLVAGHVAVACGSSTSGIDDDDGGFGPRDCCDAECVAMLGSYNFLSDGERTSVSGTATITEVASGTVLLDVEMTGWLGLSSDVDEAVLAPYDGQTIEVDVVVDAVGFAPFTQRYSLDVEHQEVCCSSCTTAVGNFDIELGAATNTFLDGCNPGGGDPACPLTLPDITDSCSAQLCCNYDAGDDEVIGCVCNPNGTGWSCAQSACACAG